MTKMTSARVIAESLLAEGVQHLFGIAGDGNLELLNGIYDSDLRFISAHHEQGAAYMAYGYARARKSLGACLSMYGPGATNLLSGVAAAYKAQIPLIALTGKHSLPLHPRDGHQQLDEVSIYRPVTKWSFMITQPGQVPEVMRKACRVALTDPMGPVHISLPVDLMETEIEFERKPPEQYRLTRQPRIDAETVRATAEKLASAQNPVIVVGREIIWGRAGAQLVRLAERLGLPVVTTGDTIDAFPTTHPLGLGPFGTWSGGDAANQVVKSADLLLILGVRFDFDLGSVRIPYNTISPKTRLIQINRHPETIGLLYPVELGAAGDIAVFLQDLNDLVQQLDLPRRTPGVSKLKSDWEVKLTAQLKPEARPIQLEYAISVIRDHWAKDRMLLADVGNFMSRTRAYYDSCQPDTFMIVEAFSALGTVFPTSLGVQVALPDRQVVCLNGDGAFFLNMAEMETSVREHLPVKVFIFDDKGYGSVATRQKKAYAGRIIGTEFQNPNLANVAREFGVYGEQIAEPHELPGAVQRVFAHDGPAVLDILTARE